MSKGFAPAATQQTNRPKALEALALSQRFISDPVEYPYLMVKEAEEAEGAEGAGGEVFWLGCLIMVNHPDLISKTVLRQLKIQGWNGLACIN